MGKTTAKTATDTGTFAQVRETIENVQKNIEVPAAAREFVQRSAATGRERAESVHSGATKLANGYEKLGVTLVGGYAAIARGLIDATHANVQHGLETVEKLALAKSLNEAVQIQADYVRENARANYERAKEAFEAARASVMDGVGTVQAEVGTFYNFGKKAA